MSWLKRTQPGRETARAIHPAGSALESPAEQLERISLRLATVGLARCAQAATLWGGALHSVWHYRDQSPAARDASARGL